MIALGFLISVRINYRICQINKTLQEANGKSEKLSLALSEAKKTESELLKQLHILQNQDLLGKSQLLENRSKDTDVRAAANQVQVVLGTVKSMSAKRIVAPQTLRNILISFSNVSYLNVSQKYYGNKEYRNALGKLIETLDEYTKMSISENEKFNGIKTILSDQLTETNNSYNKYKNECEKNGKSIK